MNDCMLEVLGDYFVTNNLVNKGWEFHEFVAEWQLGTVVMKIREDKKRGN